jgi:methionyl-tRNA formyltransferase
MPLRVIFMGTPDFAAATLAAVVGAGHAVAAVYTQPPRPAGRRGLELTKSPVHRLAESLGAEVRAPVSLKSEVEQAAFRDRKADVAVVVAYGLLLPKAILEGARLGAYNGHASLLPRWRGAAPIQRAIMAGDAETGMMVMKMDEGLDTGPVALAQRVAIGPDMTAGELHDALAASGARLMVEALVALEAGTLRLTPQDPDGATYARKISKEETRIDWRLPASGVHNRIRGLSPSPGAWCEMPAAGGAERVKLLRSTLAQGEGQPGAILDDRLTIACGEGAVRLVELQRAGGRPVDAAAFVRGLQTMPERLL